MWWRLKRSAYSRNRGAANQKAFQKIVDSGQPPGLLAYDGGRPVGWCAVAPREDFPVIERSRTLARIDDQPVWCVPCLFVARAGRGQGVSVELLKAAIRYARRQGARILEGYPVEPRKARLPDAFAWTGLVTGFRRAGFTEALRRSPGRPIMRAKLR